MKLVSVVALFSVLMLALASFAGAAPAPKPLQTFGTGVVTAGTDTATIVIEAGEYGGVYLNSKSQSGKSLSNVSFGFTTTGDVQGGAPRFSLPIDDPATSVKGDGYAFIDAANCGAPVGQGTTNPLRVATGQESCKVYFGGEAHDNWAAFAEAHPTYVVTPGKIPFIIADWTPAGTVGTFVISDITLR